MNKWHVLSSMIAMSLFLALRLSDAPAPEFFVLLAILFFLPMTLHFIGQESEEKTESGIYHWLMRIFPIAAILATCAFIFHSPWFGAGWLLYTICLALFGFLRFIKRGLYPLSESIIDSAFMYLSLGGGWFFVYTADVPIMTFSPLMILLTAIHFHYSAFFIPIFHGLLGRLQKKQSVLYQLSAYIIISSPILIAIGISFSRLFDTFSVLLYVFALYIYGFIALKTKFRSKIAKGWILCSAIFLMGTIVLSLVYSTGMLTGKNYIGIEEMIWFHGSVNAFCVILPGIIGWMMERPASPLPKKDLPFSRLFGRGRLADQLMQEGMIDLKRHPQGLVDSLDCLNGEHFSAESVAPVIRSFYENPARYRLKAAVSFHKWIRPLIVMMDPLFKRMGQLHLGTSSIPYEMKGEIRPINSKRDGREGVRAWVRTNEEHQQVFFALYATHQRNGICYMNIALPLPFSQLTAILKPSNDNRDFLLRSNISRSRQGDEGMYFHTSFITIKLPMEEHFQMIEQTHECLTAIHRMKVFGIPFLTIHYDIQQKTTALDRDH
ncbi:YndJ family protein [Bacillus sp. NPDC077027]|uniref:YndJ family protein n=1 Tax=Bacillus sp. NPDC077027 TaxID=3390548 RepID=UPI003D04A6AD